MFEDHSELMRREVNLGWDPPETDAAQETPIFGLPATSQMRAGQNFFEGFSEDMENLKKWSKIPAQIRDLLLQVVAIKPRVGRQGCIGLCSF